MTEIRVFHGSGGRFTSGVFSSREHAEKWIRLHRLSGVLTAYPLDQGIYDWAVEQGNFKPKRDQQRTPAFIGSFSSASQQHEHYQNGVPGSVVG